MTQRVGIALAIVFGVFTVCGALFLAAGPSWAVGFDTKVFRAAAVGLAVKETGPGIDKFINTFTFQRNIPIGMSTKVVPILSVGEKGYVGAAQVAGPASAVRSVQAVWLYEDNFSRNEFRLKVFVPSSSLNPFELKRVRKVGVTAIVDVSLSGRWRGQTFSHSIYAGDILRAGVVAVAINTAAGPLNNAVNTITGNSSIDTKVVPIATIGDKAYIGGAQVCSSGASVVAVRAVYQYEEIYDGGKFRIKVFVPSSSTNPFGIKRVGGVGVTALIDTSIARQEDIRGPYWRTVRGGYLPVGVLVADRFKDYLPRHDRGLHLGWYIGKGNQRKRLTGIWLERYRDLDPEDRIAFEKWYPIHCKDEPARLENRWREWVRQRDGVRAVVGSPERDRDRDKEKASGKGKSKSKGKGKGGG